VNDAPPAPDEIEVSVFGPGIGECTVVHIGDGDWMVVDSCVERETGQPIALDYLRSLNVDIATQVKLVVATHWHDDHVQGLAEVLREAQRARFVNSAAYDLTDLARVVRLGAETAASSSATKEYKKILDILTQRRQAGERAEAVGPIQAFANRRLLALTSSERVVEAEVFSLSPGDGVFHRAKAELASALAAIEQGRRPVRQGPNQLCVVLWVRVGDCRVLLGADLEHVKGLTEGWNAIVGSAERPPGRAGVIKVPHHGSINADCPEAWAKLLVSQPIAVVTAYTPARLPRPEDVDRLSGRAEQLLLTSNPKGPALPRRDNAVERTLREMAVRRQALIGRMGHVRFRCDAVGAGGASGIELKNGAQRCG